MADLRANINIADIITNSAIDLRRVSEILRILIEEYFCIGIETREQITETLCEHNSAAVMADTAISYVSKQLRILEKVSDNINVI